MKNSLILILSLVILGQVGMIGQTKISGFIFESGNRGYIDNATITLSNEKESEFYGQLITDESGAYEFTVSGPGRYLLSVNKKPYFDHKELLVIETSQGKAVYLKHELKRNPGYIFEITLAEKDPIPDAPKDGLRGALVEVYNNTKREEILVIEDLQSPEFKIDLLKGNHYTLLIRKEGFLTKRMEAFVDVEGCILCFEGIGNVTPGVSDNLTEQNSMGVLLANVEMDRYFSGKVIGLNDIYYDFGKSSITKEAAMELSKVAEFLKDNPRLKVELGSHTDSRGGAQANMSLSEKRARSAVEYLVNKGKISKEKISAKGYGETKLANNCGDGVECSDEKHRLNRRTELKVLDVLNEGMQRRLRQMKAEEFMDEILADLDNEGQIKVKEGQTIDEAIAARGEMSSTFISDPSELDVTEGSSTVEEVPVAAPTEIESTEPIVVDKTMDLPARPIEETLTVEVVEEVIEDVKVKEEEVISPEPNATQSQAGEKKDVIDLVKEVEPRNAPTKDIEVPQAVDITEKVDMSKGEGDVVAEVADIDVLPVMEGKIPEEEIIEEIVEPVKVVSKAPAVTVASNSDVEEWIRPGASTFKKLEQTVEKYKNKYSPEYSGYKVVVIFSRFELPKEHNIFSKYDDVDVYTTADGNKLYMVGAFSSKQEAYAHMNSSLKKPYPHSYVVGFENGIRIY